MVRHYRRNFSNVILLLIVLAASLNSCASVTKEIQTDKDSAVSEITPLPEATITPTNALEEMVSHDNDEIKDDNSLISHYYGRLATVDGINHYDISTKQLGDFEYVLELKFYNLDSKESIQQLSYTLREDFMPETVHNPLQIDDVNQDGNYDIILDLGIYGKIKLALCYIYNAEQKAYEQLLGFDELMTPHYTHGYVFEDWRSDSNEYIKNKYSIDGNKLVLIASLQAKYGESSNPIYTEKVSTDGEMVIIKENVTADEINTEEWDNSLP